MLHGPRCDLAVAPLVLHNDAVDIGQVQQLLERDEVHHIILSPGPGSPDRPTDIGASQQQLQLWQSELSSPMVQM